MITKLLKDYNCFNSIKESTVKGIKRGSSRRKQSGKVIVLSIKLSLMGLKVMSLCWDVATTSCHLS